MRTAVVILNWNTRDYLRKFLPGLCRSAEALGSDAGGSPLAEVIVADSASTDGSLAMLAEEFPGVRTVALDSNYGFTGGYNKAFETILDYPDAPEYIVLINSDIEVDEDWLGPLVAWMDAHPACGACGPKLHALVPDGDGFRRSGTFEYAGAAGGYIDLFGYPFCRGRVPGRTCEDRGQYDTPADVLWVSGACLMTRASLWRELGGLDPRFFAHMEEIDYCWRLALEGYSVTMVPGSTVWHIGGGTLPQTSPWKLQLNHRNNLLLLDNNLRPTYIARGNSPALAGFKAGVMIFLRMLLDGGSALVYLLQGKKDAFGAVWKAHREFRSLRSSAPSSSDFYPETRVAGYKNICIILQSALRGDAIFGYLDKRYEDSH